ncbi:MAG TPA: response regulator transcription factor [Longimicrobiales bacterium]|nr:response regulator transcription factor [Longimicrobiales bacterium]
MTLRLVLADDHSVVLQGMRAFLVLESGMEVCALCTDGVEAMEAVAHHEPDVLVMDITMPRCGGIEAHEQLRSAGVTVPTVLLTATISDETLVRCIRASVEGVVLKESAAEVLVEAIHAVARGERWVPPTLTARALDLMARPKQDPEAELTPREMAVARLVAAGVSNKRVASHLGIAESTVKLHLHSAFAKLGVRNRTQLSLTARERGWL